MNCQLCINKHWCICKHVKEIYKKTLFGNNNTCLCCCERRKVIDESKRVTKPSNKRQMKRTANYILKKYLQLQ